ncbi:MAG: type II toxin-antitoxin system HicB family antitoxin [Chloroflexi bacterium]|nr:type II toxin-antitoxin system HicB family antitoxin [Chloroflexota bacterium]
MRQYTIVLEPDVEEGGYTVVVPALPGCVTQGETIEECMQRAREAIVGYIEALEAAGESVPEEQQPVQVLRVQVAA